MIKYEPRRQIEHDLPSYNFIYDCHISGKSLTELTNKGQLVSSLPTSKSTSILTNIPSQKQIDSIHNQQQPHSNPSTLITSTSVSSNTGTTLVTNELVTTKKVVQTKTISPPVLIQVKQEPASSSSSCGVNQEFTKPHFITPSISSDQLNKNNDGLSKPILANLVAVKSEALAGQDQRLLNRNDSTNQININGLAYFDIFDQVSDHFSTKTSSFHPTSVFSSPHRVGHTAVGSLPLTW